jgi:hypothetical protein
MSACRAGSGPSTAMETVAHADNVLEADLFLSTKRFLAMRRSTAVETAAETRRNRPQ